MNRSEQVRLYLDRHMFDYYCCPEVEVEDYGDQVECSDEVDDREYEPCADYDCE